jgi:chaperonin cofactor prefoldin
MTKYANIILGLKKRGGEIAMERFKNLSYEELEHEIANVAEYYQSRIKSLEEENKELRKKNRSLECELETAYQRG